MPGRPPKVDYLREAFLQNADSARSLVDKVVILSGINSGTRRSLNPSHARRVVELAFLGLVASWDEFLEQTFVRYMAGAISNSGYQPILRLGKASNIRHAYQVLSGKVSYNPNLHYSKFGQPGWVIDSAKLYFDNGDPFTSCMHPQLHKLEHAVVLRNRVAHTSQKAKNDFKTSAKQYLGLRSNQPLRQGFSVGDLLTHPATRIFGLHGNAQIDYFEAHRLLYRKLALNIVPR